MEMTALHLALIPCFNHPAQNHQLIRLSTISLLQIWVAKVKVWKLYYTVFHKLTARVYIQMLLWRASTSNMSSYMLWYSSRWCAPLFNNAMCAVPIQLRVKRLKDLKLEKSNATVQCNFKLAKLSLNKIKKKTVWLKSC